jgi:hypothetical protein
VSYAVESEDRQFRNDDLTTTGFVMSDCTGFADRGLSAAAIVQLPYGIQLGDHGLAPAPPVDVNTGTTSTATPIPTTCAGYRSAAAAAI